MMEQDRKVILDQLLLSDYDYTELAMRIFHFQYHHNDLYQEFCDHMRRHPYKVCDLQDIPFLPIRFFKSRRIMTGDFTPELIFQSSGTTDSGRSRHFVRDKKIYDAVATRIFEKTYGLLDHYIILALLPSYLEQGDSSLIYMVRSFITRSKNKHSQFYRYDFDALRKDLINLSESSKKILLWGVTYALLDFAESTVWSEGVDFSGQENLVIMETGGMKGRRKELIREEVHDRLKKHFYRKNIHSEYGMTELLSQAYSKGDGVFDMGQTLKVRAFDVMDPLSYVGDHQTGRCHVIDLANVDSCSFVATDDLCRTSGNTFEIMGRADNADLRGCNLLYIT